MTFDLRITGYVSRTFVGSAGGGDAVGALPLTAGLSLYCGSKVVYCYLFKVALPSFEDFCLRTSVFLPD